MTQEEAAALLGCSRPTYIAIEKGERPAKAEEILLLAQRFGRTVHELVRPTEPVVHLQPHLRAAVDRMRSQDRDELAAAVVEFQSLAEDYLELERLTKSPLRANHPESIDPAGRVDLIELAEDVAGRERLRLGLGDQPIVHLRAALEWSVGLRIFFWPLPSAVAGMYAYTAELGGCVSVNQKHPPERRRFTMAHEYAHLIVDRYKPGVDYLTSGRRKPANERFADGFAVAFLMPAASVRRRFHDILSATNDFQVADLVRMSHHYYVSFEAMALRLERMRLIPEGSWEGMKESGFAPRRAATMLGLDSRSESAEVFPERYAHLAVHAYEKGEISEGELCRFLRCDPIEARRIVEERLTGSLLDDEGRKSEVRLDFPRSLIAEAE